MESVRNWKQVSPYYTCVAVAAIFQLTSFVPCCFTNIPPFLLSLSLPPSLQVPLLTEQLDVALCKLHWSPSGQHLAWMVFTGSQYKSWIKDTSDLKTMAHSQAILTISLIQCLQYSCSILHTASNQRLEVGTACKRGELMRHSAHLHGVSQIYQHPYVLSRSLWSWITLSFFFFFFFFIYRCGMTF